MKYKAEIEIINLVKSFENCTISRDDWRHAEHLTVGLHYLLSDDFENAYRKMREGIFNLLRAFEIDFSKEMPYHETLTVFWLRTIEEFKNSKNNGLLLDLYNELVETFDKDYPLKFYSHDFLFSEEARTEFVEGDLLN